MTLLRIMDANSNRACEALRVVEDYVRFGLDWQALAAELKSLRHDTRSAVAGLRRVAGRRSAKGAILFSDPCLSNRNVEEDVGSPGYLPDEGNAPGSATDDRGATLSRGRVSKPELLVALRNLKRAEESLRSLEEAAKPVAPRTAQKFEKMRFAAYSIEQRLYFSAIPRPLAAAAKGVYVLVSEDIAGRPGLEVLKSVLTGGVKWVQLREKKMGKRNLLAYAKRARELTRRHAARLVINDHADIAAVCGADGVHLGEDDLPASAARRLCGDKLIIGATAHSLDEALRAAGEGADYVSVGPVFASTIKPGLQPAGLEFVRLAARRLRIPFVAIGGIAPENVRKVIGAGARWVAVCSAVIGAPDIKAAAARMVKRVGQ